MKLQILFHVVAMVVMAACAGSEAGERGAAASRKDEARLVSPAVVDSAIPIEEALRRFRADVTGQPSQLSGGAGSRDELVQRFVRAVEVQDTAALREMVVTRAEFAYLYYPSSRYARPPTEMEPGLVWFLTQQNSEKGISRVLRRVGGRSLGFAGYRCAPDPVHQEHNILWADCQLELNAAPANFVTRRLFGSIIERNGHFKLVSYANDL